MAQPRLLGAAAGVLALSTGLWVYHVRSANRPRPAVDEPPQSVGQPMRAEAQPMRAVRVMYDTMSGQTIKFAPWMAAVAKGLSLRICDDADPPGTAALVLYVVFIGGDRLEGMWDDAEFARQKRLKTNTVLCRLMYVTVAAAETMEWPRPFDPAKIGSGVMTVDGWRPACVQFLFVGELSNPKSCTMRDCPGNAVQLDVLKELVAAAVPAAVDPAAAVPAAAVATA